MTTQIFEKINRNEGTITRYERFLFVLLICAIQMIYIPASDRVSGGIEPKLPIDIFPIWAVWVLPYILCYPLWLLGIVWATLKMDKGMFRAFIVAFLLTCVLGVSTFTLFPTYVPAATIHGDDVFTTLLRYIHENWGRYAALPSGHIYITTLLALFYNRWYPRYKFVWLLVLIVVSFSTLFTGQHYIADIIAGVMVAIFGCYFGSKLGGFAPRRILPQKRVS